MSESSDEDPSRYDLPDVLIIGKSSKELPTGDGAGDFSERETSEDVAVNLIKNHIKFGKAVPTLKSSNNFGEGSSQSSSGYSSIDGGIKKRKNTVKSDDDTVKKKVSATDKMVKKLNNEEEKLARKIFKEMSDMYKPTECMKFIYLEVHPTLLEEWFCANLLREVMSVGSNILPSCDMFDPGLVMWSRKIPQKFVNSSGKLELGISTENCNRALLVKRAEDVASLINKNELTKHISEIESVINCPLTLVIVGVKDYMRTYRPVEGESKMTEMGLELAIADLLVKTKGCDTLKLNTASEVVQAIVQATKSIAEAPYKRAKRACDEQADFYIRGENKKSVVVDKEGRGLSRLWQQMLAVLPHSSLETARALAVEYPSPLALYEALKSPDGIAKTANVGVFRANIDVARPRRVGPEFAKKLHMLFTSDDANALVE